MIKVILWDIDGTLLNFEAAEKVAIRACFEKLSLGNCTDEMLQTYSKINKEYWKRLERGEMTKPEILVARFVDFFREYHLDVDKAPAFNEEYQIRLGDTAVFYDGGDEVVTALKGKVLQCAVTNGTKVAQDRKLKNSGLDQLLDHIFISEEIGIEKPGIGFFEKVFSVIGDYKPEEILIVGDSLTSDMQGGNNAGIKTCWFNLDGKKNDSGLRIDYEISSLKEVPSILNF